MRVVNLASLKTRVTIGGTDVSLQLDEMSGSDEFVTESGLVAFRGSMKIGEIWSGNAIDDWLGINWLRIGSQILVDVDFGDGTYHRHPRGFLYVQGTAYKPGENVLEIACKIGARKFAEPIDELIVAGSTLTDIELSGGSARVIINSLFNLAGCGTPTWHTSKDFTICNRYPLSSSYLDTAGKMLASMECYAWCNGLGEIHVWDVEPTSLLFSCGWESLSDWERVLVGQPPAGIAHVTGGFRYCHDRSNPIITVTDQRGDISAIVPNGGGYGPVSTTSLTETIDPSASTTTTERVEQRIGYQIYKGISGLPRINLVPSCTETTVRQYSKASDATLQQVTVTAQGNLYATLQSYCDWAIANSKPIALSQSITAKIETTNYYYDSKWRLIKTVKLTYEAIGTVIASLSGVDWGKVNQFYGLPDDRVLTEREIVEYTEVIFGVWRKVTYKEFSQVRDSAAQSGLQERLSKAANDTAIANIYRDAIACTATSVEVASSNSGQNTPPAAERFSSAEKTEPQQVTCLVKWDGFDSSWAPRTQAYTCPYFPDYATGSAPPRDWAYQYGKTWHQLAIRRWQSVKIGMPLTTDLLNYRPYCAIAVTTNNAVYRLAMNGTSWAMSADKSLVSSDCSLIGRVESGAIVPLFSPVTQLLMNLGFRLPLVANDVAIDTATLLMNLGFRLPIVADLARASTVTQQDSLASTISVAVASNLTQQDSTVPVYSSNLTQQDSLASTISVAVASNLTQQDSIPVASRFSTANQPLQGFSGTQFVSTFADDAFYQLPDIGFNFPLYGSTYRTNIYISSNRALTFGYSNSQYNGFSADSPGRALLFGAGDRSWQELWGQAGSGKYRIIWYGYEGSSQSSSVARQIEITLFNDGAIMIVSNYSLPDLRLLTKAGGTGVNTPFSAYSANTSYVLMPTVVGGDTYTVAQGSYS